jgi:hypothetical protein
MIKTRVKDCAPTGPETGAADVRWPGTFSPGGALRADPQRPVFTAPEMGLGKSSTQNKFR